MTTKPTPALHPKVTAAAAAGSLVTLAVILLTAFGVSVPADAGPAAATLLAFAAGYLTPNP